MRRFRSEMWVTAILPACETMLLFGSGVPDDEEDEEEAGLVKAECA